MKKNEAKRRHHYVWAHYLSRWSNGNGNVFYTTKKGKIACDSVRALAVDDYFYKIGFLNDFDISVIEGFSKKSPIHLHGLHMDYLRDFLKVQTVEDYLRKNGGVNEEGQKVIHALKCNLLENLHAAHERDARQALFLLASGNMKQVLEKELMVGFMAFFGHQISRTKTFRDGVIRALLRRSPVEAAVAESMERSWWFLSYLFGMNIGASLFMSRNDMRHVLLKNETSVPFITSDQPIVNVHSCVSEAEITVPEFSDFYYPISPGVAYLICDSKRFDAGCGFATEDVAVELNSKVAASAMLTIVGNSESSVRPFMKYIGLRHKRSAQEFG